MPEILGVQMDRATQRRIEKLSHKAGQTPEDWVAAASALIIGTVLGALDDDFVSDFLDDGTMKHYVAHIAQREGLTPPEVASLIVTHAADIADGGHVKEENRARLTLSEEEAASIRRMKQWQSNEEWLRHMLKHTRANPNDFNAGREILYEAMLSGSPQLRVLAAGLSLIEGHLADVSYLVEDEEGHNYLAHISSALDDMVDAFVEATTPDAVPPPEEMPEADYDA